MNVTTDAFFRAAAGSATIDAVRTARVVLGIDPATNNEFVLIGGADLYADSVRATGSAVVEDGRTVRVRLDHGPADLGRLWEAVKGIRSGAAKGGA